jgi:hypothetical protein
MPKGELTIRLVLCLPGYDAGPPPSLRLGLVCVTYYAGGVAGTIGEAVAAWRVEATQRELRMEALLMEALSSLKAAGPSRQPPAAANACGAPHDRGTR